MRTQFSSHMRLQLLQILHVHLKQFSLLLAMRHDVQYSLAYSAMLLDILRSVHLRFKRED